MSRPVTRSMSQPNRFTDTDREVARILASLRNVIVYSSAEDLEDDYADMPGLISIEEDEYADMPALIPIPSSWQIVSRTQTQGKHSQENEVPGRRKSHRLATLRALTERQFAKALQRMSDQEVGELHRRSQQTLASEVNLTGEQISILQDVYKQRFN